MSVDNIPCDIASEMYEYGVVSPTGEFYPCWYGGHRDLYCDLLQDGIIADHIIHNGNKLVAETFEDLGWLKLSGSEVVEVEWTFEFKSDMYVNWDTRQEIKRALTKPQVEQIVKYAEARDKKTILLNIWYVYVDKLVEMQATGTDAFKQTMYRQHIAIKHL